MDSKEIKSKKPMTEAQKKARLINLQKGREIRKQKQQTKAQEYDLSSDSSSDSSESDDDALVVSRKKKVVPKEVVMKQQRTRSSEEPNNNNNLKEKFRELRNAIQEMIKKIK